MHEIAFTEDAINKLQLLHQTHPHPTVRRRAQVLVLKSAEISHAKIAVITGYCENTVRHYLQVYQAEGINGLEKIRFYRPQAMLKPFEAIVREYIEKTPPTHIAKACKDIALLTGVSIKPTQMRAYFKLLGVRCRKVASVPAKINPDEQQAFHDNELQPRLDEAKLGKRDVYFVDAAHFVLGAFLGYLWSFTRIFVRTPSGRQRFNVLGALHALTKQIVTITNDSYITSTQVCELLKKLAQNTTKPITLILDNARYQRCQLVMALADELNIELLFLPPYSPNLNLIERLWKLVKKECLYSRYYENFSLFTHAITQCLENRDDSHQEKLNTLLTLRFQLFTQEQLKQTT